MRMRMRMVMMMVMMVMMVIMMVMMDDNVDDQDDDTYIMRVGSNCLLICSNITLLILGFVSCRWPQCWDNRPPLGQASLAPEIH